MKGIFPTQDNTTKVQYYRIGENIEEIRKYNPKKIIAVVKNDAYNFSIGNTVKICHLSAGVNVFAVANVAEALKLDKLGLDIDIIILNPLTEQEFWWADFYGVHVVIDSLDSLHKYSEYLDNINNASEDEIKHKLDLRPFVIRPLDTRQGVKFHIKINVGMNRFGIKEENIDELISIIKADDNYKSNVVGLMTHFPQADEEDLSLHKIQVCTFKRVYEKMSSNFKFDYIHSENSAAFLLKDPDLSFCNYARLGILIYGYKPIEHDIKLRATMFLKNQIVTINELKKGDYMGYGNYKVNEDMKVGICPIGYGDGLIEQRISHPVYINDKYYPILNMSMSHTYIKLDESVKVGDYVEIYGDNVRFDDIKGVTNSKLMCPLKLWGREFIY